MTDAVELGSRARAAMSFASSGRSRRWRRSTPGPPAASPRGGSAASSTGTSSRRVRLISARLDDGRLLPSRHCDRPAQPDTARRSWSGRSATPTRFEQLTETLLSTEYGADGAPEPGRARALPRRGRAGGADRGRRAGAPARRRTAESSVSRRRSSCAPGAAVAPASSTSCAAPEHGRHPRRDLRLRRRADDAR